MKSQTIIILQRLAFFWLTSFAIAAACYYLLWVVMPNHYVFSGLFRMYAYHMQHPLQYILIPCFFYGIIATIVADSFIKKKTAGRLLLTFQIILITLLISSPFGGMLYFYHDMQAGYFPEHWISRMAMQGGMMGFQMGWLIVGLSIPYNILGAVVCYFLTKKGAELFQPVSSKQTSQ